MCQIGGSKPDRSIVWSRGGCRAVAPALIADRVARDGRCKSTRVLFPPARCRKYTSTEAVRPRCTRFALCAFSGIFHGAFRTAATSLFHHQKSPMGKLSLINRGSVTIHHSLAHIYFVNQTQALKSLTIICLKHIQMLTGPLNTMYA